MTDALSLAFADRMTIPARDAARVLGVDEKTFRRLVERGAVRSVLVGDSTRRFTEADLRAYLGGETCLSTSPETRNTGSTILSFKANASPARAGASPAARPSAPPWKQSASAGRKSRRGRPRKMLKAGA